MASKKAQTAALNTTQPVIPFNRILAVDTDNARHDLGDITALAADIAVNGLMEPIGVRVIENPELSDEERALLGVEDGEKVPYVGRLVFGFRRYHAIEKNRASDADFYSEVPFVAVQGDEQDVLFANLNENIARKNLTPAELAERFYTMRDELSISPEVIAERVKTLSGTYIRGLITLKKKLCEQAWDAFQAGKLTYDVAREIQKAGSEESQLAALEAALGAMEGQEGSKKKKGVKKAAAEAAEAANEAKGEASSGERSAVLRPGIKDIKAELEKRMESGGEKPSIYEQGVLRTLEWVLGSRKRIPNLKK